jgi:hypothetical protein
VEKMASKSKKNQSITFKYKFPETYNPLYANGAHGGVSSKGEIVINFFSERPALPVEEVAILEGNKMVESNVTKPEGYPNISIRYVQNGVIMNLDTAKAVHIWLGNHINQLEELLNAPIKK